MYENQKKMILSQLFAKVKLTFQHKVSCNLLSIYDIAVKHKPLFYFLFHFSSIFRSNADITGALQSGGQTGVYGL